MTKLKQSAFLNSRIIVSLSYFLLSIIALRGTLFSPGLYGLSHDWSLPAYTYQIIAQLDLRWVYHDYGFSGQYLYPIGVLEEYKLLFPWLGLDGGPYSKLAVLLLLVVSGLSMFLYTSSLGLSKIAAFISGVFYMFNPFIFNRLAAGHVYHVQSYAVVPLLLVAYNAALNEKLISRKARATILAGVIYAIVAQALQPPVLMFLVLTLFAIAKGRNSPRGIASSCLTLLFVTIIAVGLHAGLIFRALDVTSSLKAVSEHLEPGLPFFMSQNALPIKSIVLEGYITPYHEAATEESLGVAWLPIALIVTMFSFSATVFSIKKSLRKEALLWGFLGIFSIIVFSGTNTQIGTGIWYVLAKFFRPIWVLMSEIYNIALLAAVGIAVLLGVSVSECFGRIRFRRLKPILALCLLTMIFLYSTPSLLGFAQRLQVFDPGYDVRSISDTLQGDAGLYRVVWLPARAPMSYKGMKFGGWDPIVSFSPKSTFEQCCGAPYDRFIEYNLLPYKFGPRVSDSGPASLIRTSHLGQMLSISGIKYVIVRTDMLTGEIDNQDQAETSLDVLDNQLDVRRYRSLGNVVVYGNQKYMPPILGAGKDDAALVVGDLSTITAAAYLGDGYTLPPVLSFSSPTRDYRAFSSHVKTIIADAASFDDIPLSLAPSGSKAFAISNRSSWERPSYYPWWAPWIVNAQLEPPLVTSDPRKSAVFTLNIPHSDDYVVLAKVLFSRYSNSLKIQLDNQPAATLRTHMPGEMYSWVKLNEGLLSKGTHSLNISSTEGIAGSSVYYESLETIAAVTKHELSRAYAELERQLRSKELIIVSKPIIPWPNCEGENLVGANAAGGMVAVVPSDCEIHFSLYLPQGHYSVSSRLAAQSFGNLTMVLTDHALDSKIQVQLVPSSNLTWSNLGSFVSGGGLYDVGLRVSVQTLIDNIFFVKQHDRPLQNDHRTVMTMKVNPVKYVFKLNSTMGLLLKLGFASDDRWQLSNGRDTIEKLNNSGLQGSVYAIGSGAQKLTIFYSPQMAYENAVKISVTTACMVVVSLLLIQRRLRANRQPDAVTWGHHS